MPDRRLDPRLPHRLATLVRGPNWRRALIVRRILAAVLVCAAAVLALTPPAAAARAPVLVTAHELTAGVTVRAADVAVRRWPADLVPAGALADPVSAEGHVLVGAARAGEALTDRRLVGVGPAPAPGTAAVPLRLADAAVAALLAPGERVDVVTAGDQGDHPAVLAENATVLAVLAEDPRVKGRLVLVELPRGPATRAAAAALSGGVAVTLR